LFVLGVISGKGRSGIQHEYPLEKDKLHAHKSRLRSKDKQKAVTDSNTPELPYPARSADKEEIYFFDKEETNESPCLQT
jgi:hypothetical protein